MQGHPVIFAARTLGHAARRPRHGARWLANLVHRSTPLELGTSSFSWPCIDFLKGRLRAGMRVFEWGGGGSTIHLAKLGCRVTTVESNRGWLDLINTEVERQLAGSATRPEIRFVDAEPETAAAEQARYVDEVRSGAPWDAIFIDGLEMPWLGRVVCVKAAIDQIARGGMIVLDDAWRHEYDEVPGLMKGFTRREFWGLGPARLGITRTDVYIRE